MALEIQFFISETFDFPNFNWFLSFHLAYSKVEQHKKKEAKMGEIDSDFHTGRNQSLERM